MSQPEISTYCETGSTREVLNVQCYVAYCRSCGWRTWVFGGYVLYWAKDLNWKGGAGWSPGATYCQPCAGDEYFARGTGTMHPVSYAEQRAYHAIHRLGGEEAVKAALAIENATRGQAAAG